MSDEGKSRAELLQELECVAQSYFQTRTVEAEFNDFEKQFKGLFENTPVGIYRTTPDGRIIMVNPAIIRMLGYSSFEELSQLDVEKVGFAPGYPRSTFKELIERDGKVIGFESAWIKRDGTIVISYRKCKSHPR